jgi:hypothetical protein
VQDVEAGDLCNRGGADCNFGSAGSANRGAGLLAFFRRELFGIVDQGGEAARNARRKNHGGGDHWAGQGAAAHLIHAGNASASLSFDSEVRHGRILADAFRVATVWGSLVRAVRAGQPFGCLWADRY